MDTNFPQLYLCEQLNEIPGREMSPHFYYPGALTEGGRDGIIVQIRPAKGDIWLGTFAFGQFGSAGITGIFTTPDSRRFCVVAKGCAYMVNADLPTSWEIIEARPVMDVRQIVAQNLIVFVDNTRITAHGPSGMKWRTEHLSWDDLKITTITETAIICEFCDPTNGDKLTNVEVDIATGKHRSGLPPRKV